jgi:release factor glutamine methyltransferase
MQSKLTIGKTYREGKKILSEAGNECAAFDSAYLFKKAFGFDRQYVLVHSQDTADKKCAEQYIKYINQRAAGRPLQYILGSWPFMELNLSVGEGVLIPREETELLVRTASKMLNGKIRPRILDLCSGTGAVALSLAQVFTDADITAVEFYDDALKYLNCNIKNTGFNVKAVKLDVLKAESAEKFSDLDIIVSNPPYVEKSEIPILQTEVQKEPKTALDGGEDGRNFYRAISEYWFPKLKYGAAAAVEIGEGQADKVSEFFISAGLSNIRVLKDFNNIERVVAGIKSND